MRTKIINDYLLLYRNSPWLISLLTNILGIMVTVTVITEGDSCPSYSTESANLILTNALDGHYISNLPSSGQSKLVEHQPNNYNLIDRSQYPIAIATLGTVLLIIFWSIYSVTQKNKSLNQQLISHQEDDFFYRLNSNRKQIIIMLNSQGKIIEWNPHNGNFIHQNKSEDVHYFWQIFSSNSQKNQVINLLNTVVTNKLNQVYKSAELNQELWHKMPIISASGMLSKIAITRSHIIDHSSQPKHLVNKITQLTIPVGILGMRIDTDHHHLAANKYKDHLKTNHSSSESVKLPVHQDQLRNDKNSDTSKYTDPSFALKILILDHNPVNQKIIVKQLQNLGYTADISIDFLEILSLIAAKPYHLIFINNSIYDRQGDEIIAEIRTKPDHFFASGSQPIIVLMTSLSTSINKLFINDYLTKPIQWENLEKLCSRWSDHIFNQKENLFKMENLSTCLPKQIQIDWEQLHQVSEDCPDFELELLTMLAMDIREHLSNLHQAIIDNNLVDLAQEAHYIKGASANVGVVGISNIARNLETLAKSQELGQALNLLKEMEANLQLLEIFINQQQVGNFN